MVFHQFSNVEWKSFFKILEATEIFESLDLAWGIFIQKKFSLENPALVFSAIFLSHLVSKNHLHLRLDYWANKTFPELTDSPLVTFSSTNDWLNELKTADPELIAEVSQRDNTEVVPLMVLDEDKSLYFHKYYVYKNNIVQLLANRSSRSLLENSKKDKEGKNIQSTSIQSTTEKQELLIISGGPGTGKTTRVFKEMLEEVRDNMGAKILLLAPTGKATKRLSESIQKSKMNIFNDSLNKVDDKNLIMKIPEQAFTVHRFLSQQQMSSKMIGEYTYKTYDLVILDEASMISIPLFHDLLQAVKKAKKLILLGDKDQLSSVEEGSLFYDLVTPIEVSGKESKQVLPLEKHLTTLTKNYRYKEESGIDKVAKSISKNNENVIDVFDDFSVSNNDNKSDNRGLLYYPEYDIDIIASLWRKFFLPNFKSWFCLVSDFKKSLLDIKKNVNEINSNRYNDNVEKKVLPLSTKIILKKLFALYNHQIILCAKRKNDYGVNEINRLSREWLKDAGLSSLDLATDLKDGEPIIINNNMYDLGLYNGDIGIALTDDKGISKIYFDQGNDNFLEIFSEQINLSIDYDYAYATTIHKSQGSEFDQVMVIIDGASENFITREMCYTAITRAKEKIFFFMKREQLTSALARNGIRHSGLKKGLLKTFYQ